MQIIFPTSSEPSLLPTECGGRLINCFVEKAPEGSRSKVSYRRSAGCDLVFSAGSADFRGALAVGPVLFIVNGSACYSVTKNGAVYTVTALSGSVGGAGRVDMAHNMRAPTRQILIWHSDGVSQISGGSVTAFSDADLPAPNSLSYMDGYFLFTTASGLAYASDLNDTGVNELSYVTAEAQPDGLLRGIPFGRDHLLMGASTTEFWSNSGNATGYPFSRGPVIKIGLWSRNAIAGYEADFPGPLIWVASDGTVRMLVGYSPEPISTPHIQRMIEAAPRQSLRASVHIVAGRSHWVLKSDRWTLEYIVGAGTWIERRTHQRDAWRMEGGVKSFDEWLVFDETGGAVYRMNDRSRREAGAPVVMEIQSTQQHGFPGRTAVQWVAFDFATGIGVDRGISPIETKPVVSISWSDDGGMTWANDLLRELGTQGERRLIDIRRTGLTSRVGRKWRLRVSDPVEATFFGGSMFGKERS